MLFKKENKKDRTAFIFNLIITGLVIIGIVFKYCVDKHLVTQSIETFDWRNLRFFTNQSNIMMGIVALIYAIYIICKQKGKVKDIPVALSTIKLILTTYVVLTNIVTVFILTPASVTQIAGTYPTESLYIGSNLLFHVVVPILAAITWLLFENTQKIKFRYTWFVFIYYGIYLIFYLVLAYTHVNPDGTIMDGYDWYKFCHFGPVLATVLCVAFSGAVYGINCGLWIANKKINIYAKKRSQGK